MAFLKRKNKKRKKRATLQRIMVGESTVRTNSGLSRAKYDRRKTSKVLAKVAK